MPGHSLLVLLGLLQVREEGEEARQELLDPQGPVHPLQKRVPAARGGGADLKGPTASAAARTSSKGGSESSAAEEEETPSSVST